MDATIGGVIYRLIRTENGVSSISSMKDQDVAYKDIFEDALNRAYKTLSEEDKKKFDKLKGSDFGELAGKFIESTAEAFVEQAHSQKLGSMRDVYAGYRFRKDVRKKWGTFFKEYSKMRNLCIDSIRNFRSYARDDVEKSEHFGLLIRLHTNCLRISGEILCLAKEGYGSAALAR